MKTAGPRLTRLGLPSTPTGHLTPAWHCPQACAKTGREAFPSGSWGRGYTQRPKQQSATNTIPNLSWVGDWGSIYRLVGLRLWKAQPPCNPFYVTPMLCP